MNKLFTKIAGATLGFAMAIGVGVAVAGKQDVKAARAAIIGTDLEQVTELTDGGKYVIVGNNNGYALPTNPTVSSGKITGVAIASVPSDAKGYLWTFTKSGNYWLIGDGSKYIYHTNGGSSGTNLTYGTSTSLKWNLTYSTSTQNHWTFAGVNGTTVNNRGMLVSGSTFGGYALSNESSYKFMNIYAVVESTKTLVSIAVTTPPTKTTYTDGQSFDPTGMVVTATYSDSSTANVTSGCTFTPNPLTEGTTLVTVTYEGKTTTQAVTVNAATGYELITDLNVADKVIITTVRNSNNYLLPAATTSSAPSATPVTISNNKAIGVDEDNLFTVTKDSNGNFAFQNGEGNYLANTSDNNGVRINTTTASYWTVTPTTNGYKMTNNSRWCGVYTSDWRSYTTSNANNYGGNNGSGESINFYGTTKEVTPLDTIELRDYPTSDLDVGDVAQLGYYGLDTDGEKWTGEVVYTTSNSSIVEVNASTGELRAVAPGTSNITVYANAGVSGAKVESDPVTVTVLEEPERIELPVGNYVVKIDGEDETSSTVPASRDYEIKPKEGRTWYKNLTATFTDISVITAYHEYESAMNTGCLTVTNNSNAVISSVEVHYFKYINTGVGIYVGEGYTEMLEPTSSTGTSGTDNDLYRGYTNITGNTFALKNKNDEHTSKFYSVTITLTVADESEEFDSLEVSKGASWSKTSYKDNQAPSNEGLVVTAKYTTDGGETISRTEDVTALVSNWTYNPAVLHTGDTSFTVVATWDTHESAAFVVTGITVTANVGPIENGRYYIMTHDSAYGMNAAAYTSAHPDAIDLSSDNQLTAFDVNLVADNEYEITTTINDVKYYLVNNSVATSGSNDNIKITDNPLSNLKARSWSLTATEGGYYVKQNTTGTTYRYLSCYDSSNWRGYVNTNNGDPIIKFVAEGSYATGIVNSLTNTLACDVDGENAPSTTTWGNISEAYGNVTIKHEQDILKNAEYTKTGSGSSTVVVAKEGTEQAVAEAVAKYDYIVGKYNKGLGITDYNDFLNRDPAAIAGSNFNVFGANESNEVATVVVIIAIASISAFGCLLILKKRKHQ